MGPATVYQLATKLVDAVQKQAIKRTLGLSRIQVLTSLPGHVPPGLLVVCALLQPPPEVMIQVDVVKEPLSQKPLFLQQVRVGSESVFLIELGRAVNERPHTLDVLCRVVGLVVPLTIQCIECDPEEDELIIQSIGTGIPCDVLSSIQP